MLILFCFIQECNSNFPVFSWKISNKKKNTYREGNQCILICFGV